MLEFRTSAEMIKDMGAVVQATHLLPHKNNTDEKLILISETEHVSHCRLKSYPKLVFDKKRQRIMNKIYCFLG